MSTATVALWSVDVTIREATKSDVKALAEVFVSSQRAEGQPASFAGITVDRVIPWMLNALLLDEIWLAQLDDGAPVGLFALTNRELDILDVRPDARGLGIGGRLIEAAKAQRPYGLVAKVGRERRSAHAFLVDHGFASTGDWTDGVETLEWQGDAAMLPGRHKGGLTLLPAATF